MRNKRKLLAVLLTLAMALSLLPTVAFATGAEDAAYTVTTAPKIEQKDDTKSEMTVSGTITVAEKASGTVATNPPTAATAVTKVEISVVDGEGNAVSGATVGTVDTTTTAGSYSATVTMANTVVAGKYQAKVTLTLATPATDAGYTLELTGDTSGAFVSEAPANNNYTPPSSGSAPEAPTVTYTHATKTVSWGSTLPAGVTGIKIGLYSTAPSDGTEGTAVTGFTAKTLTTGTSYQLTNTELGSLTDTDLNGKYIGVTLTNATGSKTGYSAAISTSTGEVTKTINSVTYTYNATSKSGPLTWTINPTDAASKTFTIKTVTANGADVAGTSTEVTIPTAVRATSAAATNGTLTNGTYSCTYAPGDLDDGSYRVVVSCTGYENGQSTLFNVGGGTTVTSKLTGLSYNGTTLSWTYTGENAGAGFTVDVNRASEPNSNPLAHGVELSATANGTSYSAAYALPSTCTAGMELVITVVSKDNAVDFAQITYTVPGTVTPPTEVDKSDAIETATGNVSSTSTPDAVQDAIQEATGVTSESGQKNIVENANADTITAVQALNEKRQVTSTATGSANSTKTEAWLGTVAPAKATVSLTTTSTTNRTHPSGCANSTTVSITLRVNNTVTHDTLAGYVPVWLTLPSAFGDGRIVVRHFLNNGSYEDIPATRTAEKEICFSVKSFSDFQILELEAGTENPGTPGSTGGNKTPSKGGSSTGGGKVVVSTPTDTTTTTTTTNASGFTDVPDSHTFANEIKWAKDNGYMNGTGNGAFSPSNTVNRQQLWMVLARIAGANPADMAAAKAWAVENSISDGTNPTGALSRQQLVTMMFRFAALTGKTTEGAADLSTYPDAADVSGYAQEALAWAVQNGIVNGTSTGALNPWGGATRGAFAAILYRYSNNTNSAENTENA